MLMAYQESGMAELDIRVLDRGSNVLQDHNIEH